LVLGSVLALAQLGARAAAPAPWIEILPQPVLTGLIHLPGVLVTEADTVLLIAQSRLKKSDGDPSDVVLTRSLDQGRTWSAPAKIFASGQSGQIGYGCVLVEDRTTHPHTELAYYTAGPAGGKWAKLTWYGRRSTDEGATWGEPFLVKNDGGEESKPSNGGHGFQFATGRLVIPGRKCVLYSDDGGASWKSSGTAETVETKVAPVILGRGTEPNAVYFITRKSTKYRIYGEYGEKLAEEGDHGNSFTTRGRNPGLVRYGIKGPDANVLLMTGIPDMKGREFNITYSRDNGHSWSERKRIDAQAWYSDLGVTKDGIIIAAYPVAFAANLKVARFNLAWVTAKTAP
jgi:hypothetical protein